MAASVWECAKQTLTVGGSESPRAVAVYVVTSADNFGDAYAALLAAAPSTLGGLPRFSLNLDEQGGGVWSATANYGTGSGRAGYGLGTPTTLPPGAPVPSHPAAPTDGTALGPEWSFDTGGGTQHITQSRKTVKCVSEAAEVDRPSRFKNGLNVTREGVGGLDVVARKLKIWLTIRPNYVTMGWIKKAYKLTATVNSAAFMGFAAGELMLLGVSGQSQTPTDGQTPAWTVTVKWAASPNRDVSQLDPVDGETPLTQVADNLKPFGELLGWEYVWVSYKQATEDGRTVLIPQEAFREQVYDYGNFTTLGLFSPPPPPSPGP